MEIAIGSRFEPDGAWCVYAESYMVRSSIVTVLLITQLCLAPIGAQSTIKNEVFAIPIGGKLTLTMIDGTEYHGHLSSTETDSFSIREVDLKDTLVLRYSDVRRVHRGYGRPGFGGQRVPPRRSLITGAIILGALLVLVFVAVSADKS